MLEAYKKINPHELLPQQLKSLEREIKKPERRYFSDEYCDFKLWCMKLPSRQESFADFIAKKLSKHAGAKILEVGGGRTGRLSRFLGEKGFRVTCIDPKIEITTAEGVEFIKGKFDYREFDLSEYDYVVAQEPCEATEHVVRACINQNKPFIMSLCGVPHKLISGGTPKDEKEWYNYLLGIASEKMKLSYLSLDPITLTPILKSNQF
ncbi:MAG: hypothetical protein IJB90_02080 [Clostridia bacterium]|nr:hypothetical protein [Clostridia bacterium]